jgi:hypothetical protein
MIGQQAHDAPEAHVGDGSIRAFDFRSDMAIISDEGATVNIFPRVNRRQLRAYYLIREFWS